MATTKKRVRPRDIYDDAAFEQIGISEDYMFKDVFGRDAELAGELLSLALGRPVGEVELVDYSEELRPDYDARGTTFDVYLRTAGAVGDLEMQNDSRGSSPLRLRTHLSNIDREAIKRGEDWGDAREVVVVFVCTFDPVGDDLRRYTIRRHVEETGKVYPDLQTGVLLNAVGKKGDVGERLTRFLDYVAGYDGEDVMSDDFVRAVAARVAARRADRKWRRGYMTLQEKLDWVREDALAEGREEGRAEGREEGRELERARLLEELVRSGKLTAEDAALFGLPAKELEKTD